MFKNKPSLTKEILYQCIYFILIIFLNLPELEEPKKQMFSNVEIIDKISDDHNLYINFSLLKYYK